MEDSSLVARMIAPISHFIVATPTYLARYGRPQHPNELAAHQCLTYLNKARRDVWRFRDKTGQECAVTPTGQLRGTSVEAILPTVLAGMAIADLPEFIATQYIASGELEPVLTDWHMQQGGLYFVTPTARARPAKVSALADFFVARLATAEWRAEVSLKKARAGA